MLFLVVFLIGLLIPFLLIKVKPSWIVWVPSFVLFIAAIFIYGKSAFFPGEGMADLAERLYFIIFGLIAIGSIVGALIVHFFRK
ncbi:glucan phosphoethanolaminetransferase (alkaline phosphatase superfamily) [Neobacillus niacini]|uniref:hypothetical protein n=1 Tax=Neobacillus niacini TaxID=86668 RepID=UPI0027876E33|nr:hypothetical protein [Neobacillus niacini]MDQ1003154.1 glucan phosphoethanolaminetransferase (alkaline phosphatase superfamily) [Neobacillus niacini]